MYYNVVANFSDINSKYIVATELHYVFFHILNSIRELRTFQGEEIIWFECVFANTKQDVYQAAMYPYWSLCGVES